MRLSVEMRDLLIEMLDEDYITSKSDVVYNSKSSFYETIMKFRERGLVFATGRNRWNRKKWRLTEKGERIGNVLKEISEL